ELLAFDAQVGQVPLVNEHLAPVLDQQIPIRRRQILEKRAPEKRPAAARQARPLTVRAVEPLELLSVFGTRVELPDHSNHRYLRRARVQCISAALGTSAPGRMPERRGEREV